MGNLLRNFAFDFSGNFIFATNEITKFYNHLLNTDKLDVLLKNGFFAGEFNVDSSYPDVNKMNIYTISKGLDKLPFQS